MEHEAVLPNSHTPTWHKIVQIPRWDGMVADYSTAPWLVLLLVAVDPTEGNATVIISNRSGPTREYSEIV